MSPSFQKNAVPLVVAKAASIGRSRSSPFWPRWQVVGFFGLR